MSQRAFWLLQPARPPAAWLWMLALGWCMLLGGIGSEHEIAP